MLGFEYHAISPPLSATPRRVTVVRATLLVALLVASAMIFASERSLDSQRRVHVAEQSARRSLLLRPTYYLRASALAPNESRRDLRESAASSRSAPRAPTSMREFFKQRASGALSADQQQVLNMTKHAWRAYRDHAGWLDYLDVGTMTGGTVYADHDMAWTLLDSLDTLFVLGLHDEFDDASAWAKANLRERVLQRGSVKFFEATIRSLGGLLAAYYLSGDKHLLEIATVLGEGLSLAFQCPSHVPCEQVDFISNKTSEWPTIATASSFQLEFNYLSHATKNPSFARHATAVNKLMQQLVNEQFTDGLVPVRIDWSTRSGQPSPISWGAEGDSYYEYLLKQWLQSDKKDDELKRQYKLAVRGMQARMLGKSAPSGFTYLGKVLVDGSVEPVMEHLTCFVPGLLALGYKHGMPRDHLDLAKELARTCVQMYVAAATKLAPELVRFKTDSASPSEELTVSSDVDYNILRPETVESLMVLHRVTGDPVYREYGRAIMNAFEATSRVPAGGYSTTCSVFVGPVRRCNPQMESFFIAETLKYLYLLFSDDDVLPLDEIPSKGSEEEEGGMGQALCSCGGRADDDHALLFGAALAKAKLQHQQRLARAKSPHQPHGSLYHSRAETNELSDDVYADDQHPHHRTLLLASRQSSALALAEAFRAKLAESPLGPHEKMQFLLAPRAASATATTSPSPTAAALEHELRRSYEDDDDLRDDSAAYEDGGGGGGGDDDAFVTEEEWKLRAHPLISIIVPPGPCGLVLQVDTEPGLPPVVDGFVRKLDGSKGVIENSAMVRRGSVLCAINDIDVTRMALKEVVRTLNLSSHLERRFVFRDSAPRAAT
ncbi:hypothetical protein PybrP1_007617 [[Pythium] brassicae (nom. inval.)]|nr:hypothetical protein PybrP1_007617 [[Pythium] brassicae (nom. inval.)]